MNSFLNSNGVPLYTSQVVTVSKSTCSIVITMQISRLLANGDELSRDIDAASSK